MIVYTHGREADNKISYDAPSLPTILNKSAYKGLSDLARLSGYVCYRENQATFPNTSSNTSGRFIAIAIRDFAAPEGSRRPCSQS